MIPQHQGYVGIQSIRDNILFRMPRDRELQWPAMSLLQKYVNSYDERMGKQDVSSGRAKYELHYDVEISHSDWQIFLRAGLKLDKEPNFALTEFEVVIDFSDEKLLSFLDFGAHVCQICGKLCGEEGKPLPEVKQVKASPDGYLLDLIDDRDPVDGLFELQDGEVFAVLGEADWKTYLLASMRLPVIEIQPEGRPRYWLTKFANPGYHAVTKGLDLQDQIERAKQNIRRMLLRSTQGQAEAIPG